MELEEQLKSRDAQINQLHNKYNEISHTLADREKALQELVEKYYKLQESSYRDRIIFEARLKEEQTKVPYQYY